MSLSQKINKEIIQLAIPNVITTLTIPLLSMADFALMGRLENELYINAVGIGAAIFNMLYWVFGFLRMGTTGLAAQAYGADNKTELSNTFYRALSLGWAIALLVLLLHPFLIQIILPIFDNTAAEKDLASNYFFIRIWAAPAVMTLYVLFGWFLGIQKAVYVMWVAVVINLLNVGLNFLFVRHYGMDVDGIAWATVISQYTGVLMSLVIILWRFRSHVGRFRQEVLSDLSAIKNFFTVNTDIFIRTLCLVFTFTFFTARSGSFGTENMAVNQLLLQFMHLLSYGVDGFAMAAESLVGKYFGAKDKASYKLAIKYSFYWGLGIAVGFTIIFAAFGNNIIRILTNLPDIISAAQPFMIWIILMPLINSVAFIWDGVYIGRTATKAMRSNMLLATFLIFLPVFYLTKGYIGNHSLWLAMTMFMVVRGGGLSLMASKHVYGWGS